MQQLDRREFIGAAAMTIAASQVGPAARVVQPGAFSALRQIDAGVLSVSYVDAGPSEGTPVLLLHGWPYDIHAFAEVTPILVASGYRVIVPFLRGYGTTRFRSASTTRNGQPGALAMDARALLDAHRDLSGGIGHNLPQEAPREFAQAIVDVSRWGP